MNDNEWQWYLFSRIKIIESRLLEYPRRPTLLSVPYCLGTKQQVLKMDFQDEVDSKAFLCRFIVWRDFSDITERIEDKPLGFLDLLAKIVWSRYKLLRTNQMLWVVSDGWWWMGEWMGEWWVMSDDEWWWVMMGGCGWWVDVDDGWVMGEWWVSDGSRYDVIGFMGH